MNPSREISRLLEIMAALRDPNYGCPWDIEQDFSTIRPYTIEEAYEVADAIERNDMDDLCDELGDLLLQVVFHAQMAKEAGAFEFGDVVESITRKMIRRHPHVFDRSPADTSERVKVQWDQIKAEEKAERRQKRAARSSTQNDERASLLDEVPVTLPALTQALKLQQKAAKVSFDWNDAAPIFDKAEEEIAELREALSGGDIGNVRDEFGDVLFVLVNLGRHIDADPEMALRGTNRKFRNRFAYMERELRKQNEDIGSVTLDRMEELWNQAKTYDDFTKVND